LLRLLLRRPWLLWLPPLLLLLLLHGGCIGHRLAVCCRSRVSLQIAPTVVRLVWCAECGAVSLFVWRLVVAVG
jgi:hypothetical protein